MSGEMMQLDSHPSVLKTSTHLLSYTSQQGSVVDSIFHLALNAFLDYNSYSQGSPWLLCVPQGVCAIGMVIFCRGCTARPGMEFMVAPTGTVNGGW